MMFLMTDVLMYFSDSRRIYLREHVDECIFLVVLGIIFLSRQSLKVYWASNFSSFGMYVGSTFTIPSAA